MIRSLYTEARLSELGRTKKQFETEASQIIDLYFEAFQANASPWRKFWRNLSLRGSELKAGYLSHEWRTLIWNSLKKYKGGCFRIAMVARYDPESGKFVRHWISVTLGRKAAAWGDRSVLLDPWLEGTPSVFPSAKHEKGNWLGTAYDEELGPGGTLLDEAGQPTGGETGPLE